MPFTVALIQGDSIGPEIVSKSKRILAKLNELYSLPIEFIEVEAGDQTLARYGEALPKESLKIIDKADMILKGLVGEV